MKILCVAGARPNFMKIAPLMAAFRARNGIDPILVHTGQHYDERMSDLFFRQLEIPAPDINLGIGSGTQAWQTAEIMKAFEPVLLEQRPDVVLVVGDVTSTIACGLVAVKLGVMLVHVEAGLRSFDRAMPEEINRVLTDAISDLLLCTEQSGVDNLLREGVAPDRIALVGNVMIDTLLKNREKAASSPILEDLGLVGGDHAVVTLHRPSNVDDEAIFGRLLDALEVVQAERPVIFPIHPRTRQRLASTNLGRRVEAMKGMRLVDPLGYLEFLRLLSTARIVLTDSGGVQEETTILRVPCLTLRENTERPVTVAMGTNLLVGTDTTRIVAAYREALARDTDAAQVPPLWDGGAAERIVDRILAAKA